MISPPNQKRSSERCEPHYNPGKVNHVSGVHTALWLAGVYPVANECSVVAVSFCFRRQLRKLDEEFEVSGNRADNISMGESVAE